MTIFSEHDFCRVQAVALAVSLKRPSHRSRPTNVGHLESGELKLVCVNKPKKCWQTVGDNKTPLYSCHLFSNSLLCRPRTQTVGQHEMVALGIASRARTTRKRENRLLRRAGIRNAWDWCRCWRFRSFGCIPACTYLRLLQHDPSAMGTINGYNCDFMITPEKNRPSHLPSL